MRYRSVFDDLFDVFRDFDTLFRRTFPEVAGEGAATLSLPSGRAAGSALAPAGSFTGRTWFPAVDSFEREGNYVVRMELPGVAPGDVNVSVTGDHLQISGEKKSSREVDERNVHFSESRYGRFERSFRLPEGVKGDDIRARYENGVLELTIPVPEDVKPKTVKIEVAADQKKIKAA